MRSTQPQRDHGSCERANSPNAEFAEHQADPLLLHSIREQLRTLTEEKLSECQRRALLSDAVYVAVSTILLQEKTDHQTLTKLFSSMYEHALQSMTKAGISQHLLTYEYISPTGFVMSPLNCSTTIKDIYRVSGFARGIHQAISMRLETQATLRILYPACGPFAPLLLPLLHYYQRAGLFRQQQIQVTLVDIHPGAIQAVSQLVADLEIDGFIEEIVECDATAYQPEQTFDLLVLEAMQHGFSKEGQLSIARHLIHYLAVDGILIPQETVIHGIMVHGETEFNQQWRDASFTHSSALTEQAVADRVALGELFRINRSSLLKSSVVSLDAGIQVIKANQITLPDSVPDMVERILAVYADLVVYADETVQQYDSGITHPKPDMAFYIDVEPRVRLPEHFVASSGDKIQFYYQLTGLPGFIAVKGAK